MPTNLKVSLFDKDKLILFDTVDEVRDLAEGEIYYRESDATARKVLYVNANHITAMIVEQTEEVN